jgi:nucleoside-diphosphate-sugar epimerase
MAERVLVTGAAGFIGGYLVPELLARGHVVAGLDNFSKYGPVRRSYDTHPRYHPICGDAANEDLVRRLLDGADHFIAGAAMVGGIGYFHSRPYDLLAENERITAAAADAAILAHRAGRLRKVTWISSSMVYESATTWPSAEGDERTSPPPRSSYGWQKLGVEYFARAAWDQYQLPYTILRPFNCVGAGEATPTRGAAGNERIALSHVVPDLVAKVMAGQDPLHILGDGSQVRHYTYGGDLARGITDAMTHPAAFNEDFNLSTAQATSVLELAAVIWDRFHPGEPLRIVAEPPYPNDVQLRSPDTGKAKRVLGFEATTPLGYMVNEVINWLRSQYAASNENPLA